MNEYKKLTGSSEACVVFFTAKWCGPCKSLYPLFDELKAHNKQNHNGKVMFIKVNVEEDGDIADYYKVKTLPTFFFYHRGKLIKDFEGANKEKLVNNYNSLVDMVTK